MMAITHLFCQTIRYRAMFLSPWVGLCSAPIGVLVLFVLLRLFIFRHCSYLGGWLVLLTESWQCLVVRGGDGGDSHIALSRRVEDPISRLEDAFVSGFIECQITYVGAYIYWQLI